MPHPGHPSQRHEAPLVWVPQGSPHSAQSQPTTTCARGLKMGPHAPRLVPKETGQWALAARPKDGW